MLCGFSEAQTVIELQTPRLLLRQWRDEDLADFAALNGDAEVMRYFPACLDRAQSDALAERIRAHFAQYGYGLWALERRDSGAFIGFTGLLQLSFAAPFAPAVEIGWRLGRAHWGQGLALEAARAARDCAFAQLGLAQLVSFTVPANQRSRALMQRLGLRRDEQGDFAHPRLPATHPLSAHVLYRLSRQEWQEFQHD